MSFNTDQTLADRVAVVTGATRGIGRQVALALGQAGARVVVVGRTSDAKPNPIFAGTLQSVVAELAAQGTDARMVQADITDGASTQQVIDDTLGWFGRCDILINNAAYTSNGPILEVPWRRWERGFRAQVVGPLQLVQGFVPGMLERGYGRVVDVSSEAASVLGPGVALYSVTKQAMERMTEYLHYEAGGRGVSFNVLHIDVAVLTATWQWVNDHEGADVATLGGLVSDQLEPEVVGRQIAWMVDQPSSWSGNIVGCREVTRLGGPGD
jgi:NAD(P)-dependent dehydrogenase (short-subunit alcohol dehydrogenase family)